MTQVFNLKKFALGLLLMGLVGFATSLTAKADIVTFASFGAFSSFSNANI